LIILESEFLDLFEGHLNRLFPERDPLSSAARYALFSGGKRLRPLLLLTTAEMFGSDVVEKALIPACAVEMIHTYSLIHDDLPCMDNDDWRRGKPTLHKVYGEWHALLTGDFLLTYTFELLSEAPLLTAEQKISLIRLLSHRAGASGMIGGQVIDLLSQDKEISWEHLVQMHQGKTAALIAASIESGAIIGKARPSEVTQLSQLGRKLGLAFQLIDDLLDAESERAHSINATFHLGKEETERRAEALLQEALCSLTELSLPTKKLEELADVLVHRTR
jgi:geranylgeranyl diphosphate synthase, type II